MRLRLAALAFVFFAASSCHKYHDFQSPTVEQSAPKHEFWTPPGNGNGATIDQSKIKGPSDTPPLRVLFVGNSLVFRGGMPNMLQVLAEAAGQPMRVGELDLRGKTLTDHVKEGDVATELSKNTWDDVVLQENSDAVVAHKNETVDAVKALDALIHEHGAKTIVMLTWSHLSAGEREKEQPTITAATVAIAKAIGAHVAPIGEAHAAVWKDKPDFALTDTDHKHPNFRGAYLGACVMFSSLLARSPVGGAGPFGGGLGDTEVTYLQTTAWKTVQSSTW